MFNSNLYNKGYTIETAIKDVKKLVKIILLSSLFIISTFLKFRSRISILKAKYQTGIGIYILIMKLLDSLLRFCTR